MYFGGASPAAERVSAAEADVQLFWGEPLDGIAERIERLRALSVEVERNHPPLEFGLRITTVVRDTADAAWAAAEQKIRQLAGRSSHGQRPDGSSQHDRPLDQHRDTRRYRAVGQQRLLALADRGDVLDTNLYTAPGRYGGGGAGTTWLVGSPQEVADSLLAYRDLGIGHFILSDTPYLPEIERQGRDLVPRLLAQHEPRPLSATATTHSPSQV